MMTWNHRVMRRVVNGDVLYAVHEVYYDGDGMIIGWSQEPLAPEFDETNDCDWSLRQEFERQMQALDKPVLDLATGEEIADADADTDKPATDACGAGAPEPAAHCSGVS